MNRPSESWQFDDDELPWWAGRRRSSHPLVDPDFGVPAPTPEPVMPIVGRMMWLRVIVAIAFPMTVWIGHRLSQSASLAMIIVGSAIVGFLIGIIRFFVTLSRRVKASQLGPLAPRVLPVAPSINYVLVPMVLFPIIILATLILFLMFENRFVGLGVLVPLCLAAFYYLGDRPILFMRRLLLANPIVGPADQTEPINVKGRPEVAKLAILLLIVWLVPAYTSNTLAIVGVLIFCGVELRRSIVPLLKYGNWPTVLAALWRRGGQVALEYLDYQALDRYHCRPTESLSDRRANLTGLFCCFDLTLLVGLAYYCPWEPFAALCVPNFQANFLFVPDYAMTDYRWLLAPALLVEQAQPLAGYLLCFVLAIVFFFLIPTAVLFLIYIDRLVELELLAQRIKHSRL